MAGSTTFHSLGETGRMGTPAQTGSGAVRSGVRNDFSGWYEYQGSPQGGGSPKKGSLSKSETIVKHLGALVAAMAQKWAWKSLRFCAGPGTGS